MKLRPDIHCLEFDCDSMATNLNIVKHILSEMVNYLEHRYFLSAFGEINKVVTHEFINKVDNVGVLMCQ